MNTKIASKKLTVFGYECLECGRGAVLEKVIPRYKTKIKGYPIVIPDARIGVCDACDAEHFSSIEVAQWTELLAKQQEASELTAEEITALRERLRLSMTDFAVLIGSTRQSLYHWERKDRGRAQSRMADLLMKLVRESAEAAKVDVIQLLLKEAERTGASLKLENEPDRRSFENAVVLKVRLQIDQALHVNDDVVETLAADSEGSTAALVLVEENGKSLGKLSYDFATASLNVEFFESPSFDQFDAEVRFKDGDSRDVESVPVVNNQARLLETHRTDDEVDAVVIKTPSQKDSGSNRSSRKGSGLHGLQETLRKYRFSQTTGNPEQEGHLRNAIYKSVLPAGCASEIWDEQALLLLSKLFESYPPNASMFGDSVCTLKKRSKEVRAINDLFYWILNPAGPDIPSSVAGQLEVEDSVVDRVKEFQSADGGKIRPSQRIERFLEDAVVKQAVGLRTHRYAIDRCVAALRAREHLGYASALLVDKKRGTGLVMQVRAKVQEGAGQARVVTAADGSFSSAVERAYLALQEKHWLSESQDLVVSLEQTNAEYSGNSIALAAAMAAYSAAREFYIDPYTAFTGDINVNEGWRIERVDGIREKLSAAIDSGYRRVVLPKSNESDVPDHRKSDLNVIFVTDLLHVFEELVLPETKMEATTLQDRKMSLLNNECARRGWQLSSPMQVQGGKQVTVSPPTGRTLKVTVYNSGAHSPKNHPEPQLDELLAQFKTCDHPDVPIRGFSGKLNIEDSGLQETVSNQLESLQPSEAKTEQYCLYSLVFKNETENVAVKQYSSGTLLLQGRAGGLLQKVAGRIVTTYNLHNPTATLSIDDVIKYVNSDGHSKDQPKEPLGNLEPQRPYIGTDESGKGDYFGPLIVAAVWVDDSTEEELMRLGVRDSKVLNDKRCLDLAARIKELCREKYYEVEILPERYNTLHRDMRNEKKNLNHLLAWGHARAIESLLAKQSSMNAVADQFGDQKYIESKLMEKGKTLRLLQTPKAERFTAVAAASILARARFLARLRGMSKDQGCELPKGSSEAVVATGRKLVSSHGPDILSKVAKLHFKTTTAILGRDE